MTKSISIILSLTLLSVFSSFIQAQKPDLQGHRGARGLLPENTIPSMLKALDIGASTLELDVVISADYPNLFQQLKTSDIQQQL